MSAGRCSGCGKEDKSCKVISSHILSCPQYREKFLEDSDSVREPEDEYRRHQEYLQTDEGIMEREEQREANHLAYKDKAEAKIARSRERWSGDAAQVDVRVDD